MSPAKNIALFIDGTWNDATGSKDTNVRKLFEMSVVPPTAGAAPQLSYYLPGVGKDLANREVDGDPASLASMAQFRAKRAPFEKKESPLRRLIGGGSGGWGTAARIKEAYAFLSQHYERAHEDRVYIFGFSRGAFAARSLTGFISRVGLLFADKLDYVDFAYELYERGIDGAQSWLASYVHQLTGEQLISSDDDLRALRVHFIGVWDTVGALGFPRRMSQFTAPYTEYHQVEVPPNVMTARHAIAIHEMREDFQVMLWSDPNRHGDLKQVWFPGNHGDVGGGHPLPESGLADEALNWMADEARQGDLRLMRFHPHHPHHARILHQPWGWFYVGAAEPRWQLSMLSDLGSTWRSQPFDEWRHSAYFSSRFRNGVEVRTPPLWARPFRRKILEKLKEVDDRAEQIAIIARLLGITP